MFIFSAVDACYRMRYVDCGQKQLRTVKQLNSTNHTVLVYAAPSFVKE